MPCFGRKEREGKDQVVATTSDSKLSERPASASQVCPAVQNDDQSNQQDRIHEKCINRQKASDDKVDDLNDTVERLKTEAIEKQKEIKKLRDEHFKLTEERNTEHLRVVEKMKKKMSMQEIDIQNLKVANEDLLTRLSAMAGARLTDNNANIADLSDVNRPTKLAEKYSEFYDNEWTDAYEVLTAAKGVAEKDACHILLKAFCTVYSFCDSKAKEDREKMLKAIKNFLGGKDVPPELMKQLKDQRKRDFGGHIELLRKDFKEHMQVLFPEKKQRHDKRLKRFLNKGIELCWLMAVQDPPVILDVHIENRHGEKYDSNSLKPYTRSGLYIDYIVWPPLYLHEGGNILCKGIVQCKSDVSAKHSCVEPQVLQEKEEMTGIKAKTQEKSEKTGNPVTEGKLAFCADTFNRTENFKPITMVDQNELSDGKVVSVVTSNHTENENLSDNTNSIKSLPTLHKTGKQDQKMDITTMTNAEGQGLVEAIESSAENRLKALKTDDAKNESDFGSIFVQETTLTSQKNKERQKQARETKHPHSAVVENNKTISNSDAQLDQSNDLSSNAIAEAKPSAIRKRNVSDNTKTVKDDKPAETDTDKSILKTPNPSLENIDTSDKVKHAEQKSKPQKANNPTSDRKRADNKLNLFISKAK